MDVHELDCIVDVLAAAAAAVVEALPLKGAALGGRCRCLVCAVEVVGPPELVQHAGVVVHRRDGVGVPQVQPRQVGGGGGGGGDVGALLGGVGRGGAEAGHGGERAGARRRGGDDDAAVRQRVHVEGGGAAASGRGLLLHAQREEVGRERRRRRRGRLLLLLHGRRRRYLQLGVAEHRAAGGRRPRRRRRRRRVRGRRGGVGSERLVGGGVDAAVPELLLDVRVPEVLDLVVGPPRQLRRDLRPPGQCSGSGSRHCQRWHRTGERLTDVCATTIQYVLVAKHGMQLNDEVFLLLGEGAPLEVWPEVVYPPQPAALAASLQS